MTKEKIIIKNAHCKFFEGQTGLCKAKEFTKCNPVNCKLYTIDELSTILELQEKLKHKEQECEQLKSKLNKIDNLSTNAFCLTHGTNKDMNNFAKQILCLIRKRRMK